MTTFETEKHNIPEGATHYFEATDSLKFAWWNENKALLLCPDNSGQWEAPRGIDDISRPIPIPQQEAQMNIDNLATQTPEEKEALDSLGGIPREHLMTMIKQQSETIKELRGKLSDTPHQYEMSKFSGNEWNGEGLPPVGSLCKVNRDSFTYRVMYSSEYVVIVQNLDNDNTTAHGMDIILDLHKGNYTFSKPESPQQREERERLEAAYDLFCVWSDGATPCSFDVFVNGTIGNSKRRFLAIVDKTNYRKESN